MYVRIKRVERGDKTYEYVQLVEGRRVDGKVKQKVVATLGRLDELKASGQLDRLAGSFARLDPPPVGTRREVGPLLLVRTYLARLGLAGIVDRAVP
ncbi:MAG: IS1634 family transposase, partial [Actinobacteria bacterium]|nr:IS1634 family transposase [Actinomycetota bacterium]